MSCAPGRSCKKILAVCDQITRFYNAEIDLLRIVKADTSDEDIEVNRIQSEILLEDAKSNFNVEVL